MTRRKHTKQQLIDLAIAAIDEESLYFNSQVIAALPCVEGTFYDHKLQEVPEIRERLDKNQVKAKKTLQKKWLNSSNATLQIALYKLLSTDEERRKLNQQQVDHTSNGKNLSITIEDGRNGNKTQGE